MAAHSLDYQFDFSGGALCLDFANTLGDRPRSTEEHLHGWMDVLSWGEQAGVIAKRDAARLRAGSPGRSPSLDRAFGRAIALREQIYRTFSGLAAGHAPNRDDLAAINMALGSALSHLRVAPGADGFTWAWDDADSPIDAVLWPVIRSAGELLVSADRPDVRECASGVCSWLFLDRSPARRRRWCSMKTCGNRDKARRFYQRQQESKA